MDRTEYAKALVAKTLVQFLPTSESGDTVTIKITRISDNYTWNFSLLEFENAVNTGVMTWVADSNWKSSFTPPTADTYLVYINNSTKSFDDAFLIVVSDGPIAISSPTWGTEIVVGTNSYVTADEATTYFATRMGASTFWDALTDAEKTAAIITAYYQLTTCGLFSLPTTATDTIKRGQLEQALFLAAHGQDIIRRMGLQSQGVLSAGIVKETYDKNMRGQIPVSAEVLNMLKDYKLRENAYAFDLTRDDDEEVL